MTLRMTIGMLGRMVVYIAIQLNLLNPNYFLLIARYSWISDFRYRILLP